MVSGNVALLFLPDSATRRAGENIVPWHIKNVTPKILTKMLRSTGTISQKTEVKTITRTPVGDNEDGRLGVLSCIFRLSIEYNRMDHGGGPLSVIYKASSVPNCTQCCSLAQPLAQLHTVACSTAVKCCCRPARYARAHERGMACGQVCASRIRLYIVTLRPARRHVP